MSSFLFKEKSKELQPVQQGVHFSGRKGDEKKKIVVASGCRGAGISFVAGLLAEGLRHFGSVSYVEMNFPHMMEALGLEKHFVSEGFQDCFQKLRDNQVFQRTGINPYEDVHWVIRDPQDWQPLTSSQIFRLYHHMNDQYTIFDCSGVGEEDALALLAEADIPLAVISPLPSKLSESRHFIEEVRFYNKNAILIVNSMNKGVHLAELHHFLGTKDYFSIPSVPLEYIYKAEYNGVFLSQLPPCREVLKNTQELLFKLF